MELGESVVTYEPMQTLTKKLLHFMEVLKLVLIDMPPLAPEGASPEFIAGWNAALKRISHLGESAKEMLKEHPGTVHPSDYESVYERFRV